MVWKDDPNFLAQGKSNFVCLTLNVQQFDDPSTVVFKRLMEHRQWSFIHAGRETAPTTGQKHWQGYVEFHQQVRHSTMKDLLPRASFRVAKGTAEQNIAYDSKEDPDPFEAGEWRNKGHGGKRKRADLDDFVSSVREGLNDAELFVKHSKAMVMYPRAANNIRSAFVVRRTTMPCIRILWGNTGCGKSYQAIEIDGAEKIRGRFPFLIGYTGLNDTVVMDEFRPGSLSFEELLDMTDKRPPAVEFKGGERPFNATLIYICSNIDPRKWYPQVTDTEQWRAFMRRIEEGGGCIKHCTTRYVSGTTVPSHFVKWGLQVVEAAAATGSTSTTFRPISSAGSESEWDEDDRLSQHSDVSVAAQYSKKWTEAKEDLVDGDLLTREQLARNSDDYGAEMLAGLRRDGARAPVLRRT